MLSEKLLCEKLNICRKTIYLWRTQGMPYKTVKTGQNRFKYDLSEVISWARINNKKLS